MLLRGILGSLVVSGIVLRYGVEGGIEGWVGKWGFRWEIVEAVIGGAK